jgi:hypothetical protein
MRRATILTWFALGRSVKTHTRMEGRGDAKFKFVSPGLPPHDLGLSDPLRVEAVCKKMGADRFQP